MASQSSPLEEPPMDPQKQPPPPPPPAEEQHLQCPRCDSTNTKFCYYNNYSLSQPRYICKSCRRYWTKGGTLRNVPIGGGCRKNKKPSSKKAARVETHFAAVPETPNPALAGLTSDPVDLSLQFGGGFSAPGFLSSIGGEILLEAPKYPGFGENLCRGLGSGGGGIVGPYEETAAKLEVDGGGRVFWGSQWQVNSDNEVGSGSSSGRDGWVGPNASTWHALLNGSNVEILF